MSIFEYAFMQRAFIVGILLGMTIPCIGTIIVLKRLSMLGDTLSHTSLAGVAGGLVFHINPVVGATVTCIGAALGSNTKKDTPICRNCNCNHALCWYRYCSCIIGFCQ